MPEMKGAFDCSLAPHLQVDGYMVMASDGVWDVLDNQQVGVCVCVCVCVHGEGGEELAKWVCNCACMM